MNYDALKKELCTYMDDETLSLIDKYYEKSLEIYDCMKRSTGEDYICHPIEVAYILAKLRMDPTTIGCALMHEGITLGKVDYDNVKNEFGEEIANTLRSISKISSLKRTFNNDNNKERYRKIIVGLADNPKVLFIKFADRLHNLRTIYVHEDDHQKEVLDETQNIYIPIAHRLGMKSIMSEMEDLCLKYSEPKEYNEILTKLNASRNELEESLLLMKNEIIEILEEHNIKFKILSRVKSVRGIYNKLKEGKKWENIYDMLGLRIIVDKIEECYLVIGYIHARFKPIPKRFKDFIANPKSNMYQSVHTTVFGIDGRMYEIQVRTFEMDDIAETGIASHWSYKEKSENKTKGSLEERLESFRSLIEVNDISSNSEFFKNFESELKKKEIYVFTPKGDVIDLPKGSTPIDFAYRIHSDIGNTLVSALVNGKIVKLDYALEDGDIVNLNTQKGRGPSKSWLHVVKTDNAKSRIRSYFYKKEREKLVSVGKEMLELEAKKRKLNLNDLINNYTEERILTELKLIDLDDLYFSIATLKFLPINIINKLDGTNEISKEDIITKANNLKLKEYSTNILVTGKSDIKTSMACCCNPVYGEDIIGYITKGCGVKVHTKNCKNVLPDEKRIIEVSWNDEIDNKYSTFLNVYIDSYNDNLIDIIALANKYEINVKSMNMTKKNKNEIYYTLNINVKNINLLNTFIEELNKIKYVSKVERAGNYESNNTKM
jgi:GTP pyrophosphokinase